MFIERDIDLKLMQVLGDVQRLRASIEGATFAPEYPEKGYLWDTPERTKAGALARVNEFEAAIRGVFRVIEDEMKILAAQEAARPDIITFWDEEYPKKSPKAAPKKEIQ